MIAALTQRNTIRSKHQVREDFSECSSGNTCYETKGCAIHAFESALAKYGLYFDPDNLIDMPGDNGRVMIGIYIDGSEYTKRVGCAVLMWYRMPSGRWEFVGYIA